jgi:predicted enzyme related to lactoylglutathione lyase
MPHDHPHDHDHDHGHDHPHPVLRLHTARLYAGDFAAAFAFYAETLGLKVVSGEAGGSYAQFDTGAAQLGLERIAPNHPAYGELVGRFAGLSFAVADLGAFYDEMMQRGVEFMAPPQKQSWGGGIAHFRDPAGNILSVVGKL